MVSVDSGGNVTMSHHHFFIKTTSPLPVFWQREAEKHDDDMGIYSLGSGATRCSHPFSVRFFFLIKRLQR